MNPMHLWLKAFWFGVFFADFASSRSKTFLPLPDGLEKHDAHRGGEVQTADVLFLLGDLIEPLLI
jgi:hypothetical protein